MPVLLPSLAALLSLVLLMQKAKATISPAFISPPAVGINVTENSDFSIEWDSAWGFSTVSLTVYQQNPNGGWSGQTLFSMYAHKCSLCPD